MGKLNYRIPNTNDFREIYVKVTDTLPVGAVCQYGGSTAPSGYLMCNGQAVSRTTYADLFKAIGTSFGAGDGITTFNVPNFNGRVPVGLDGTDNDFDTIGETGGSKYLQEHKHSLYWGSTSGGTGDSIMMGANRSGTTSAQMLNEGTGNSGNLQPYIVVNYIIKASKKVALDKGNVVDSLTGEDTDSAPSVRAVKSAILDVEDITSKITKTSNVGTIYSLDAYKKGSRCYLNTIFDLNAVGNVFTLDNSILPKYGEIATGTNYDTNSMATCIARISTNNANISVDVYGTKKDYAAMHIEWEV